jgi:hypothetical protein
MDELVDMRRSNREGRHRLMTGVAVALGATAFPAVASATDYCVAPNQSCDQSHNVQFFEQALDRADDDDDPDRIILGADTYTAPTAIGFDYLRPTGPVEIVGQGAGQTTLTSPDGGSPWVMRLVGGPGSSVHDLTIRLPKQVPGGFSGLHTRNIARRIEVVEDSMQDNVPRYGVDLVNGGSLEDSSVSLNGQHSSTAVALVTPDVAVRRSTLSARVGAESYGGTIERSRLNGAYLGLSAFRNTTTIAGSLIRTTDTNAWGIFAEGGPSSETVVNADGVTIVGPGLPDTIGAGIGAELADADITDISINLTNSLIRGVSTPLSTKPGGAGKIMVSAAYSDYDPSRNSNGGGNASINETNISNVGDARFVDAAGGDYHLQPGSPLIDMGDPTTSQGLDLDGSALVTDGNADGAARRDLGAFELQPAPAGSPGQPGEGTAPGDRPAPVDRQAPLVSGFRATPAVFTHRTRFRYSLSEAAHVKLTIQRRLPGRLARYRTVGRIKRAGVKGPNGIRFRGRIGRRTLRSGRYRAVIAAIDAAGNRSTQKRTRFRVAAS